MEDNGRFLRDLLGKQAALNALSLLASTVGPVVCGVLAGRWYGSEGLAVSALCSPLFFLAGLIGFIISGGASVLCAKAIARNETDEASGLYSAALLLSALLGLAMAAALILLRGPVMALLSGGRQIDFEAYFICCVLYALSTVMVYVPLYFARTAGRGELGLIQTGVMTVVSLVSVFLLRPLLGIAALALGQAIGSFVATVLCIVLIAQGTTLSLRVPRRIPLRQIVTVGSPLGLPRLYAFVQSLTLNNLFLASGGAEALAVYGAVGTLNRFLTSITLGVSQPVVPLASVFSEERDVTSARQLVRTALVMGNIALLAAVVLLTLLHGPVEAMFGLQAGALKIPLLLDGAYLLVALNTAVLCAHFNASGHLGLANLSSLLQDCALLLPLAFLLSGTALGLWASLPLAAAGALAALLVMSVLLSKRRSNLSFPLLVDTRMEKDGRYTSFSVQSEPAEASEAAAKISAFCEEAELGPKQTMLISMAVEEMLTLIIGQMGGKRAISVRLLLLDGTTILRIRFAGGRFDPIEYYHQEISGDFERQLDVIGIKYVVESAEVIDYRQMLGVNNLVVLI